MVSLLIVGLVLLSAAEIRWRSPAPAPVLTAAGYAAAILMLWRNRDRPWLRVLLVGAVLNAAVIVANAGRMPVSPSVFERIGRPVPRALLIGADPRHVLAGPDSPLVWLGDRLALHAGQLALVVSVGDLVLAVGLAGFVQSAIARSSA